MDVAIGAGTASVTTIAGTLTMGAVASMTNAGLVVVANQSNITGLSTITSGTWAATDVAVAHGGTGASTALAGRTNLGIGEGDSPQLTAINVGHASDSTLARASAGDLSIEGNIIYRAGGTDVPVTDGGTGVSSFTGDAVMISNAAGTAMSFIDVSGAQSQYNVIGFNSSGVPVATTTIDGGTF